MNSADKNNRALETMSVLAFVSLLAGILFHFKWALILSVIFLFIGIFQKKLAESISANWLKFAEMIGTLNGRIILSVIFFLILTPIAWLNRFFRKDALNIKTRSQKSLWVTRDHVYEAVDLQKPW